jgi:hypothetical protein
MLSIKDELKFLSINLDHCRATLGKVENEQEKMCENEHQREPLLLSFAFGIVSICNSTFESKETAELFFKFANFQLNNYP